MLQPAVVQAVSSVRGSMLQPAVVQMVSPLRGSMSAVVQAVFPLRGQAVVQAVSPRRVPMVNENAGGLSETPTQYTA